jgi:hypothetical protein
MSSFRHSFLYTRGIFSPAGAIHFKLPQGFRPHISVRSIKQLSTVHLGNSNKIHNPLATILAIDIPTSKRPHFSRSVTIHRNKSIFELKAILDQEFESYEKELSLWKVTTPLSCEAMFTGNVKQNLAGLTKYLPDPNSGSEVLLPGGEKLLQPLDPTQTIEESGLAHPVTGNVHVIARKHMTTARDVHNFLLYTPFQRHKLRPGTTTMPTYTPIGHALNTDHNLYYMVQDKQLPGRMYQDLKSNYLHYFDNLVKPDLYLAAKMRYTSLADDTSYGGSVVGSRGASIIANRRLDICDYLVRSLGGNNCAHHLGVMEEEIGVKVSWLSSFWTDDGRRKVKVKDVLACQDVSPAVFRRCCTQTNIELLEGPLTVQNSEEQGLKAIILKAGFL